MNAAGFPRTVEVVMLLEGGLKTLELLRKVKDLWVVCAPGYHERKGLQLYIQVHGSMEAEGATIERVQFLFVSALVHVYVAIQVKPESGRGAYASPDACRRLARDLRLDN